MPFIAQNVTPAIAEANTSRHWAAAHTLGLETPYPECQPRGDFEGVSAELIELRAGGLVVGPDIFVVS
jgi:hypothetical protein